MQLSLAFGLDSDDPWDIGGEHPTTVSESELCEDTLQSANYKKGFDLFDHQVA